MYYLVVSSPFFFFFLLPFLTLESTQPTLVCFGFQSRKIFKTDLKLLQFIISVLKYIIKNQTKPNQLRGDLTGSVCQVNTHPQISLHLPGKKEKAETKKYLRCYRISIYSRHKKTIIFNTDFIMVAELLQLFNH